MCGRYASARKRQDLLEEFRIDRDRVTDDLEPDYNVAPTKPVYAVLTRSQRGPDESAVPQEGPGAAAAADVARKLRVVRWGLVPFWAKDIKGRLLEHQRQGRRDRGQAGVSRGVPAAALPRAGG